MTKRILKIEDFEDANTQRLFKSLSKIRQRGYLTKNELVDILNWKTRGRPIKHYSANTEKEVKEITRLAFETKNDKLKIHILTALNGVRYPSASAILMFYDKRRYPVLDIRVWKQLHKVKLVKENPRGQNFTLKQWEDYLKVIRQLAVQTKLTPRQVEKRLFDHSVKTQKGNLYE
jgi:hypothetical protein